MFRKTKRLFEPTLKTKKASFKAMIESAVGYISYDIIPIFAIPYVIGLITAGKYEDALTACWIAFAIHCVFWILNYSIRVWDMNAKYDMNAYIEKKYRKEIFLKDHKAFDLIGTGKVQSIVQKGIDEWSELNWQVIYQIPKLAIGLASGLYVMLKFDVSYLVAFIVVMFVTYALYAYFRVLNKKYQEKSNDVDDVTNATSVRSIMSRQEIVFSAKVDKEIDNFVKLNDKSRFFSLKAEVPHFLSNITLEATGPIISFVFVALILSQNISNGSVSTIDVASLIFLIYFASRFVSLMYNSSWMIKQILDRLPKIEKFWKFLDDTPALKNYENGDTFVQKNISIIFDTVSFAYGEKKVLENFSLTIPHGKKIALVGKSGSGKTTIAKLVTGYMYPDSGVVSIDGQDLSKLSLKSYYRHIGYLTQEPMIFDGSVRENLVYALNDSEHVSDEVLWKALKSAECDFILDLEAQIGEKGIRLSGGERQRLAIAKLMLKNPEIIVLDEPTSALDSFSEEKITKALDGLFKGRTVVIIAHRLQTIKKADNILVLEAGKIIEEGKHNELMAKHGVYYKIVELQSGF